MGRKRVRFGAKLYPCNDGSEMENGVKGACATTMGRVCTPENWPTQKKWRLSQHETKTVEKKKQKNSQREID